MYLYRYSKRFTLPANFTFACPWPNTSPHREGGGHDGLRGEKEEGGTRETYGPKGVRKKKTMGGEALQIRLPGRPSTAENVRFAEARAWKWGVKKCPFGSRIGRSGSLRKRGGEMRGRCSRARQEYAGAVLDDEPVAAHIPAPVRRSVLHAVRARVAAGAASVVGVPSNVEVSVVLERPRAPFDAFLRWVVRVAGVVAAVDHVEQDQVTKLARFGRNLAGNHGVHVFGCSWGMGACENDVRVRQASLLVLDHANDVPTLAAKL
eukprot:9504187-Pyramimonas_sp.AAC.6